MGFMDKFKDAAKPAGGQSSVGGLGGQASYRDRMMRLNQSGVETPATIKAIRATGRSDVGGAEYEVEVDVRPPSGEPYSTSFNQAMVEQQLESFKDGAEVTLKVDPDDPGSMILWGTAS